MTGHCKFSVRPKTTGRGLIRVFSLLMPSSIGPTMAWDRSLLNLSVKGTCTRINQAMRSKGSLFQFFAIDIQLLVWTCHGP